MRVAPALLGIFVIAMLPQSFAQTCSNRVPDGGFRELIRTGESVNGPFPLGTVLNKSMQPIIGTVSFMSDLGNQSSLIIMQYPNR